MKSKRGKEYYYGVNKMQQPEELEDMIRGQLIKQERAKKGMKLPDDLSNVNKETVEQFNVKINEDAFDEILKTKNACIDLTQYNEDDYIVPLTQKHHEQGQRQDTNWWERDKTAGRSKSQGGKKKLAPLKKRKQKKEGGEYETVVTSDQLYRGFSKAGNIDRPDMSIPLVPFEFAEKLNTFVEEHK